MCECLDNSPLDCMVVVGVKVQIPLSVGRFSVDLCHTCLLVSYHDYIQKKKPFVGSHLHSYPNIVGRRLFK